MASCRSCRSPLACPGMWSHRHMFSLSSSLIVIMIMNNRTYLAVCTPMTCFKLDERVFESIESEGHLNDTGLAFGLFCLST